MLSESDLAREAAATGFQAEPLEKVLRLLELLESLRSHPFLKERIVLKGGTALNLFVFDVARLSVDIDLNYIGAADRETMLQEKPKINQAVEAVCGRLRIQVKRVPTEHAGGKWRLSYVGTSGRSGTMELDLNFLMRTPLWAHGIMDSRPIGSFAALAVPVLDIHELAAGKLAALFGRNASRDLFDSRSLLLEDGLDRARLRLGFLVYGGASRRDWRTVSIGDVRVDPTDVERRLVPVLRADLAPDRTETKAWSERLVSECRDLLSTVLPLNNQEIEFLTRLNDDGAITPELLTDDMAMQATIRSHPALRWKAQNVRDHKGRG
ncbi:MAG: nucleotidyl transferase AbiEii/AbiGii toxin family protein [Gemmatimonadales bacterium]